MQKREQLVETAFKLFYTEGIHAVGINQILAESGIAKKTLYHHFSSKDDLILAVIEYRDEKFFQWLKGHLEGHYGVDMIKALFDALDDWFNDRAEALMAFRGCLFINACAEFKSAEHPIHQLSATHKAQVCQLFEELLSKSPDTQANAASLANALSLLKEGAICSAFIQGDRTAAKSACDAAMQLVQCTGAGQ